MNNTQAACERLTQSRDRLRQALSPGAHPAGGIKSIIEGAVNGIRISVTLVKQIPNPTGGGIGDQVIQTGIGLTCTGAVGTAG